MTKRSVDDLYGGRHRPYGQVRDGSHRRIESEPPMESASARDTAFNKNTNQAPPDFHDNKGGSYDNDVSANSWLRSDGTRKPSFDKSGAWRMKDSNDWHSTTQADKVSFVKPEPVGPNAKQMRKG